MFTIDDIISAYEGAIKAVEDFDRVKEAITYVNDNLPQWTVNTCARVAKKAGF